MAGIHATPMPKAVFVSEGCEFKSCFEMEVLIRDNDLTTESKTQEHPQTPKARGITIRQLS